MLDFLLLPTSRTYWHDHVQTPNLRTPSFLDSSPDTSTHTCVSLGFNGNNWIDHQGVENFFFLKTLSLCEGKLLKDLTRDSHKSQYEQEYNSQATKTLERFGYKTLKPKEAQEAL